MSGDLERRYRRVLRLLPRWFRRSFRWSAHGYLSLSVAGQTWLLAKVPKPFTGTLPIAFASRNEILQLRRLLVQSD
jgi:hypothetical protein